MDATIESPVRQPEITDIATTMAVRLGKIREMLTNPVTAQGVESILAEVSTIPDIKAAEDASKRAGIIAACCRTPSMLQRLQEETQDEQLRLALRRFHAVMSLTVAETVNKYGISLEDIAPHLKDVAAVKGFKDIFQGTSPSEINQSIHMYKGGVEVPNPQNLLFFTTPGNSIDINTPVKYVRYSQKRGLSFHIMDKKIIDKKLPNFTPIGRDEQRMEDEIDREEAGLDLVNMIRKKNST